MTTAGGAMLGLSLLSMMVGGKIISIFFPELKGNGIPPAMWYVLIPIWSIGIIGLLLLFIGWVKNKSNPKP